MSVRKGMRLWNPRQMGRSSEKVFEDLGKLTSGFKVIRIKDGEFVYRKDKIKGRKNQPFDYIVLVKGLESVFVDVKTWPENRNLSPCYFVGKSANPSTKKQFELFKEMYYYYGSLCGFAFVSLKGVAFFHIFDVDKFAFKKITLEKFKERGIAFYNHLDLRNLRELLREDCNRRNHCDQADQADVTAT